MSCLPRDLQKDGGMSLLNELCSLSSSILTNADGSQVALRPATQFLNELVYVHGSSIEERAIEIVNHSHDEAANKDEAGKLLEGLIMSLIEASQSVLGAARGGEHQRRGQEPFESKIQPEPEEKASTSIGGLAGIFSILTVCVKECPVFLLHLRLRTDGPGHRKSLLVGRAVDSASAALTESDVETVTTSLVFLESAVSSGTVESLVLNHCVPRSRLSILLHCKQMKLSVSSEHESIRQKMTEILSRDRRGMIMALVDGICGKYHQSLLEPSANLLYTAVRSVPPVEMHMCLLPAIQQSRFRLGEQAQRVALQVLDGCAQGTVPLSTLRNLVQDVWDLHQVDDVEAIADSDIVTRFTAERYHA